jgi:hypothetical protein
LGLSDSSGQQALVGKGSTYGFNFGEEAVKNSLRKLISEYCVLEKIDGIVLSTRQRHETEMVGVTVRELRRWEILRELMHRFIAAEDWAKHNFATHGGNLLELKKDNGRRSTRLTRQIMIEITSLEPACDFRGEYTTVVVNAQGCGVILREQLRKELSVMVKLVADGRSNKGHVVLSIPLSDTSSWLTGIEFDSPSNFWEIADPPADWPLS